MRVHLLEEYPRQAVLASCLKKQLRITWKDFNQRLLTLWSVIFMWTTAWNQLDPNMALFPWLRNWQVLWVKEGSTLQNGFLTPTRWSSWWLGWSDSRKRNNAMVKLAGWATKSRAILAWKMPQAIRLCRRCLLSITSLLWRFRHRICFCFLPEACRLPRQNSMPFSHGKVSSRYVKTAHNSKNGKVVRCCVVHKARRIDATSVGHCHPKLFLLDRQYLCPPIFG